LHRKIWSIADDVRGAVDGWDFKQYILGILFYRFISENITDYFNDAEHEAGDLDFDYSSISDEEAERDFKPNTVEGKGFFILPSQLFKNVVKTARENEDLNTDLANIFKDIEGSAIGYGSEEDIKGLFEDVDTTSNRLGGTVEEKNKRLVDILVGIAEIGFGDFKNNHIDAFGDAYEYLISNYASNAGKSGGEFFTPQSVSRLLARIVMDGQSKINKVYDPTCGSGSLLLQMKKQFEGKMHIIEVAERAMKNLGITPEVKAIRGGTDGAQLSYMGLPCPNIFAGGLNFHGPYEYVPLESMEKATEVIIEIAQEVEKL